MSVFMFANLQSPTEPCDLEIVIEMNISWQFWLLWISNLRGTDARRRW